jgi:hypothetical protein
VLAMWPGGPRTSIGRRALDADGETGESTAVSSAPDDAGRLAPPHPATVRIAANAIVIALASECAPRRTSKRLQITPSSLIERLLVRRSMSALARLPPEHRASAAVFASVRKL